MSNLKYHILCRYEYWGREGTTWSNWFHVASYYDTEILALEKMKEQQDCTKDIDKKLKLNREYKIEEIDIDLLPTPAPYVPKVKRPRGRPRKEIKQEEN
jgi:hypothetical protein